MIAGKGTGQTARKGYRGRFSVSFWWNLALKCSVFSCAVSAIVMARAMMVRMGGGLPVVGKAGLF